jgi:tetratricopeptide (TPR) repeat protein
MPVSSMFPPVVPERPGTGNLFVLAGVVMCFLIGASWLFLPPWFKHQAEKLAGEGNHGAAVQNLRRALYVLPFHAVDYRLLLGRELRFVKDFDYAQKVLEQVLASNPDQPAALREVGQVLRDAGQLDKAFESFKKFIQAHPEDIEVVRWASQIAFQLKNYDGAVLYGEKVTQSPSATAEDWKQLGFAYHESKKDGHAVTALLKAVEADRNVKGARSVLAAIYLVQGKVDDAVSAAQQEMSLAVNDAAAKETYAQVCLGAGNAVFAGKDWGKAVRYYQDGLSVRSSKAGELNFQLAHYFAKKKNKKQFLSHLQEAVKADPGLRRSALQDSAFIPYRKSKQFQQIVK